MNPTDLTEEQEALLYLLGKPDDGNEDYPLLDLDRVSRTTSELIALGLVYDRGKDSAGRECFDLTDAGEVAYQKLGGGDYSILVAGFDPQQNNPT